MIFEKGYDPQLRKVPRCRPCSVPRRLFSAPAEQGKRAFEIAYGCAAEPGEPGADLYWVNNPNADRSRIRSSPGRHRGCGAVLLRDGRHLQLVSGVPESCTPWLSPDPVYGGTEYFFRHLLPAFHIRSSCFGRDAGGLSSMSWYADLTIAIIYLRHG